MPQNFQIILKFGTLILISLYHILRLKPSSTLRLIWQAHLLEIPHNAGVRSFHINRADCIGADNTITHRTVEGEIVTEKFLTSDPEKNVVMGVTSGASTRKWHFINFAYVFCTLNTALISI